jgi:hypothetical protein
MSNQLGFAIRYLTIVSAGLGSLLAGATTVHHFIGPDLTLPPPPPELQSRARAQGISFEEEEASSTKQ